jgi:integrase/recombinase XerD
MKLTQLIAQYVTFRKSLGENFESHERLLRTFSRAVGESVDIYSVKPARVATFLAGRGPVTPYWHKKYGVLRGFFHYAVARGYLSASPLPATVPKQPPRFVPHIYSMDQLRRLLNGTVSYQKQRILMEPHTFERYCSCCMGLLYASVRVSH